MRVPNEHSLARTYALRDPNFANLLAEQLAGTTELAELEGLVELVLNTETSATTAATGLRSLAHDTSPLVADAMIRAVRSPHPSIRILAAGDLHRRGLIPQAHHELVRVLTTDPFWQVRRAAVNALAREPGARESLRLAATDPHWRVRYALASWLQEWGREPEQRSALLRLLEILSKRAMLLQRYLQFRWNGAMPEPPNIDDRTWCPFWDWDAAVLARNIDRMTRQERCANLDQLVQLVTHADERVRLRIVQSLRDDGSPVQWSTAIALLSDPRDDAHTTIEHLTRGVEFDRIEAVAKLILRSETPQRGAIDWAMQQVGVAFPAEEVAADIARLNATRSRNCDTSAAPFPENHPYTRAATLTLERARDLIQNPTLETSWFVLARAAKLCRVSVWSLAPEKPWKPNAVAKPVPAPILLPRLELVRPRQLGVDGPVVSPLGVSGHYGLPVEGFVRAAEQGVNLFFWEPNYATLSRFVTRLSPSDRRGIHILAGTFEAEPAKIRGDVERAVRNLQLERLSVFLIFWTQSGQRLTHDVRAELDRLKRDGLVQVYGLSTHNREIARDVIHEGWDPVMVRHSAAYRKAETDVFPHARERGTSIITFNNTCYGRLLDSSFRPSDCYRFTLNTPGVTACFTAPATLEFLEENLDALRDPELSAEVRERLVARGTAMYREDTAFRRTVRADV